MSFVGITKESLEQALEREIPDVHLLVAKNSILGLDAAAIAEVLGVSTNEIQGIEEDREYKEVRVHVAAHYNNNSIERDFDWDAIESQALKNIGRRIANETSLETNLKVAAVANRAARRHSPVNKPLHAGEAGGLVQLKLTKRIIERLSNDGGAERETISEVSLRSGYSNPTFADIDEHLGVTARPRIPSNLTFRTAPPAEEPPLDLAALDRLMEETRSKRK